LLFIKGATIVMRNMAVGCLLLFVAIAARADWREENGRAHIQNSFSADLLADASLGSRIRLRCAAPTAPWSCAISFSLRSGGVASSVIGQSFLGLPSLVLFDMSSGLQTFWRNEKMPVNGDPHKMLLSMFNNVGMHSKKRR
jgi:hypothetical protein